ncbi:MAG: hypothetical protein ACTSW1_01805 [Candidatus Hodarchaeales archaeon]
MELSYEKGRIAIKKELNYLDELVISFTNLLEGIDYVLISGYIAILFGRNRASEDIDILIQNIEKEEFFDLWERITQQFECINTSNPRDALNEYLQNNSALRFFKDDNFIPNIEMKFVETQIDKWTLKNRMQINLNNTELFISPIELQIAYKLYLDSEKDIEDAKFLYELFKEKLDQSMFQYFIRAFKQEKKVKRFL